MGVARNGHAHAQTFFHSPKTVEVVYEDNHIIIVSKAVGEIVQGDKTGDTPLSEIVKAYIKEHYTKPGAVFLGVPHRLDRPVAGLVVLARTSKALTRLGAMFRDGEVDKTYWAIVCGEPPADEGTLEHWLTRNERLNKSFAHDREKPGAKRAVLRYTVLTRGERYSLVEVKLLTGRHHQIRCQMAAIRCPIKGDLKYGAKRSNPDGGISLLARRVEFIHPVSRQKIVAEAPLPDDGLWRQLAP